ncbi:MAG: NFACT family protein [Candidatus Alcyoniella australis]|nr:NFACT family protein [Candidatus Alcyoniella australis]
MSLSEIEISQVVQQLEPLLPGATIQRTLQPQPHSFVLHCRGRGETIELLCDLSSQGCRLHRTWRKFTAPPEPPRFDRLLRKHLRGARIVSISKRTDDRAVRIELMRMTDDGPQPRTLLLELFGKSANAFVLGPDDLLLDSLFPAKARARGLEPGGRYLPPTTAGPAVKQRPSRIGPDQSDPSRVLDELYADLLQRRTIDLARNAVHRRIQRQLKRTSAWLADLQIKLEGASRADELQREAETLSTYRHELRRGLTQIELPDPWSEHDGRLLIKLRPELDPQTNIDRAFDRVRRLRAAATRLGADIERATQYIEHLQRGLTQLDTIQDVQEVEAIAAQLEQCGALAPERRGRKRQVSAGPRSFISRDGLEILVGRNDRENDELTFRVARGNDYWLHTRDAPSSHVIVRLERGRDLPGETLIDAATLTLHYSRLKGADSAEVIYARAKHVRKPRGAAPGKVSVTAERSLLVRLEPERLQRLLSSRRALD